MAEPVPLRPGALSLRAVAAAELPRDLLAQKKTLDVERFYESAQAGLLPVTCFVVDEEGIPDPVCLFIMARSPIYRGVLIDTLVVDQARRTDERVRACLRLAKSTAEAVAREIGETRVFWSTDRPERMINMLGDRRVRRVETTLELPVDLEDEE